jgi:hypothetical protein
MLDADPKTPLFRTVAGLVGLTVLGWGIRGTSWQQDMHYKNWFGELIFAPLAILFGLIILFGALFKPQILGRPPKRFKH